MGKDLTPQGGKRHSPIKRLEDHPLFALQREMNRLFDNFFGGFDMSPMSRWERGLHAFSPHVDVVDNQTEIRVTAELAGMDDREVDVSITKDALILKGEKRQERDDHGRNYFRTERSFGTFERMIPLPIPINSERAQATFKNGVLTVVLPKLSPERKDVKRINVKKD